jgi:adenylylsulfate kinase
MTQKVATIWLTGLSGAGKSSIALELERRLVGSGHRCIVLDGDNVRRGLNRDLGFSPDARKENIRRIAEVAKLFNDAGLFVITALISPYREDRDNARAVIGADWFIETYLDADLSICERRDPKGLYAKARAGLIPDFTGISAPYEMPHSPALTLATGERSIDECVAQVLEFLANRLR